MGGSKKLIHPFPGLAIPGDICKLNGLFTLFAHLLSLSVLQKESGLQTPDKMVIQIFVCHLFVQPAFRIKSYSLPQQLVYLLIGCPVGIPW